MSRSNEKCRARRAFERDAAKYILGEVKSIDLKGTGRQVRAASDVLKKSRELYRVLQSNADLSECKQSLDAKRLAASQFRAVFGYTWPF